MKYALTGHTSGIGLGLFKKLSPNVIGFSRSNGYDITHFNHRQRIISESQDCDVFINNACVGFSQTELFIELFRKWQNKNKIIINVGSQIAEISNLPEHRYHLLEYQASKILLKEMSKRVSGICKVKYKWFGYVGTEAILKKYPHFTEQNYISVDRAVEIILS